MYISFLCYVIEMFKLHILYITPKISYIFCEQKLLHLMVDKWIRENNFDQPNTLCNTIYSWESANKLSWPVWHNFAEDDYGGT